MSSQKPVNDLPLSDALFARFRDLLLARAGLYYNERRRVDLAHALSQAARNGGYTDLGALYAAIVEGGPAWDQAIAQLTIGETYFFRNGAQFAALRERILPDLLARRGAVRSLRLWSAGCATGEEPYSLAMAMADAMPSPDWQVSILATDINPQFIERAREALYGAWSFRETPDEVRARYFSSEGPRWRLHPELRRQVSFARLNLAEPSYPAVANGTVALDLIFCRNVTIYFDEATTRQVVDRFFGALAPGGWLVVGHAEPHNDIYKAFETHNAPGAVLYRKPLSAPAFVSITPGLPAVSLPSPHLAPRAAAPRILSPRPARRATALLTPPSSPAKVDPLASARDAANRGDWPVARRAAEAILADSALSVEAHYILGLVHEHHDELEAALAAYRRSVYLDGKWVLGTLGMAGILRQMGHPDEARRSYRSALRQLERLEPTASVPGAEQTCAAELLAHVQTQLEMLG